jgi:hypothetical protein
MTRLFLLVTSVALASGCYLPKDFRIARSKLQEMKTIAIPIFPGAVEVGANERSGAGTAIVGKRFKSSASYEDLKKFYLERLLAEGWEFHADRPLPTSNAATGERLLEFCKGEYSLTVQFAGRAAGYGWDYTVDIVWPGKDVCGSADSK